MTREDLIALAENAGSGTLDEVIHDAFAELASRVNSEGTDSQVDKLIELGWSLNGIEHEIRQVLLHRELEAKYRREEAERIMREMGPEATPDMSYEEWTQKLEKAERDWNEQCLAIDESESQRQAADCEEWERQSNGQA